MVVALSEDDEPVPLLPETADSSFVSEGPWWIGWFACQARPCSSFGRGGVERRGGEYLLHGERESAAST